jgi:hypothetical protein
MQVFGGHDAGTRWSITSMADCGICCQQLAGSWSTGLLERRSTGARSGKSVEREEDQSSVQAEKDYKAMPRKFLLVVMSRLAVSIEVRVI